jgi:hypothetical protein
VYGLGWSARPDRPFRLAIGSFIEEYRNKVSLCPRTPGRRAAPSHSENSSFPLSFCCGIVTNRADR